METKSDPVHSVDHRIASTGYVISLDVPDFRIDDIRVHVKDGVLSVAGQLAQPSQLEFERTFRVPADFSQTPTLSMSNGVLTVELQKDGGSPVTGRKTPTKNYELPPRTSRKQSRGSVERAARTTGVDA